MKKILLIVGLVLQVAAVITAGVLSTGTGYTSWTCYENTANEDALMDCSVDDTPEFSQSAIPAVPITLGLLGLGLVVGSVAVGSTTQANGSAPTPTHPQPHQPTPQPHPQSPLPPHPPHPPSGQPPHHRSGPPPER